MVTAGDGDGWVILADGSRRWGLYGASGLLLYSVDESGTGHVLLQHRAPWTHQGGTWGLPGGALLEGEDPVAGALREAAEEVGVDATHLSVLGTHVLDHGTWRYTTVIAVATGPQHPRRADDETLEAAWVDLDAVTDRPLLVAFGEAWPTLRARVEAGPAQG